jgi:hypothetical protein
MWKVISKYFNRDDLILIFLEFATALYVILDSNHEMTSLSYINMILIAIAFVGGYTTLATGCILLFYKNRGKVALIFALCGLLVMEYSRFCSIITAIFPALGRIRYLLVIFTLTLISVCLVVLKSKHSFVYLARILSLILICLIVYTIAFGARSAGNKIESLDYAEPVIKDIQPIKLGYQPDIFFIVLDSYARSDFLKRFWEYDNREFEEYLISKGFAIASKSFSPEYSTYYSIASILNMGENTNYGKSKNLHNALSSIKNSYVIRELQAKDYDIVNLSLFDLGFEKSYYNVFDDQYPINKSDGFRALFSHSIFSKIVAYHSMITSDIGNTNIAIFDFLGKTMPSLKPRFIYAHLLTPHSPASIDEKGHLIAIPVRPGYSQKNYLAQLKGTNILTRQAIESILAKYPLERKPIIIIQGDHGSRLLNNSKMEKFAILNAVLLPGGGNSLFYSSISPYNTFKVIFNAYYNKKYKLLPDIKFDSSIETADGF